MEQSTTTSESTFDTRHLIMPEQGRLLDMLPPMLSLSTERVSELLHLGSVYLNKIRVLEDQDVPALSYIRVHCLPKRYQVNQVQWSNRIVFENQNFLVVNKPAGFPVISAVDNVRESVYAQMQNVLDHEIYITQRLDVPTQGLTVFAKNREFQTAFNGLLARKSIYKEYLARTSARVPMGLHVHFMPQTISAPKIVYPEAPPESDWKECRLYVHESQQISENNFTARIQLLTGRTHQIRAQMKALSCPLWGDSIYQGKGPPEEFFLQSRVLKFTCPLSQKDMEFTL